MVSPGPGGGHVSSPGTGKEGCVNSESLASSLEEAATDIEQSIRDHKADLETEEVGHVHYVGQGIVRAKGLGRVKAEEMVLVGPGVPGIVLDILPDHVGIVLFQAGEDIVSGDIVKRTRRVLDIPVGDAFLGRVIDPLGRPLDGLGPIPEQGRRPVESVAPPILQRAPVDKPLQTGIKVIDALIPIGCGQRELVLGDRQTGKSSIALDTIVNQKDKNVLCVYCAIGQRSSSIAKFIEALKTHGAMDYTAVVVVEGDDEAGLQYVAPYAATSLAEHFMLQGKDVLIVYDDLTRHAQAYRQISLLLRRPPGREAYPGDIFYLHSRLLERATHLKPEFGGGSLTAIPIIETEAQNISAYIPTNLISITDGQIYLSPELFQRGLLPAVDVGKSVSRVGGKAQFPAYRKIAGDLRLSYSQFQELEAFARFGTRLDERTKQTLAHGQRAREVLKQKNLAPLTAGEQVAVLMAASQGLLDMAPLEKMDEAQELIVEIVRGDGELNRSIPQAKPDSPELESLHTMIKAKLEPLLNHG
ncbi:MAG: alternate F1F0 ATPase, F1 subunit alpha [Desulfatibacillum sp.]|nr:alternate F1F0 ATPase, F1 subunit alpha [Desulfatibacillum sp.]